jgi:maltose alpha-D-glucosyltransferase / alpha-amylase
VIRFASEGGIAANPDMSPPELVRCMGSLPSAVDVMGRRLAEFHIALAALDEDESFRPEAFTSAYQRSLYQGLRSSTSRAFHHLQEAQLRQDMRARAEAVLGHRRDILSTLRLLTARRINAARTRIHGDMDLSHLLYTGRDFLVADCTGDPERPLTQRAIKRSPLRDVAGMIASFHRVLTNALLGELGAAVRVEDLQPLRAWARAWLWHVAATLLQSYGASAAPAGFLPADRNHTRLLLYCFLLEKEVAALSRYIGTKPSEVIVALDAIDLLSKQDR